MSGVVLEQVEVEKLRVRSTFRDPQLSDVNLADLAKSIKESGQLYPLLVTTDNYVVDGRRRLKALPMAGKRAALVIRVRPKERNPEKGMRVVELAGNLHREKLNEMEVARAYRWMLDHYKMSQSDLARLVGVRPGRITAALHLLDAPKHVQESLEKGKISKKTAAKTASPATKAKIKFSTLVPSLELPEHVKECRLWRGDKKEWELVLHGTGAFKKLLAPKLAAELEKAAKKARKTLT